jgi:hypothetical protein
MMDLLRSCLMLIGFAYASSRVMLFAAGRVAERLGYPRRVGYEAVRTGGVSLITRKDGEAAS